MRPGSVARAGGGHTTKRATVASAAKRAARATENLSFIPLLLPMRFLRLVARSAFQAIFQTAERQASVPVANRRCITLAHAPSSLAQPHEPDARVARASEDRRETGIPRGHLADL